MLTFGVLKQKKCNNGQQSIDNECPLRSHVSLISASSLITMWTEPLISWYWTDGSMTTSTEWGIIGGYYPLNTFFTHSLRKCKTLTCFIADLLQSYIFSEFCSVPPILHAWNGYYGERCWYKPSLNILCEGTDVCVWVYLCIDNNKNAPGKQYS